ncbi:hypothetical protein LBMAG42_26720 [Deltaproteobacteria bacterium]|nr:hypothetical protein LBMAG42_26720 [Deltaproteobacteria bacterium]
MLLITSLTLAQDADLEPGACKRAHPDYALVAASPSSVVYQGGAYVADGDAMSRTIAAIPRFAPNQGVCLELFANAIGHGSDLEALDQIAVVTPLLKGKGATSVDERFTWARGSARPGGFQVWASVIPAAPTAAPAR